MRSVTGVVGVVVDQREQAHVLSVQVERGAELTQALLTHLDGTHVGRVASREPTLEDAYVALVGKS
jgi:ABC-2 type transport system ATP-binding protein